MTDIKHLFYQFFGEEYTNTTCTRMVIKTLYSSLSLTLCTSPIYLLHTAEIRAFSSHSFSNFWGPTSYVCKNFVISRSAWKQLLSCFFSTLRFLHQTENVLNYRIQQILKTKQKFKTFQNSYISLFAFLLF